MDCLMNEIIALLLANLGLGITFILLFGVLSVDDVHFGGRACKLLHSPIDVDESIAREWDARPATR